MISLERFEEITEELACQLPEEFFRELSGGVIVREQVKYHPAALANDLYTLGNTTDIRILEDLWYCIMDHLRHVTGIWKKRYCGGKCGGYFAMSFCITWNHWRESVIWRLKMPFLSPATGKHIVNRY